MTEKYFYIEPETARELLSQTKGMKAAKRGIDSHVYLTGEYAVLTTGRLKLRNIATRDDDLAYLDELTETLMRLHGQGVAVVPILGYCYDPDSKDGEGFIFQPRAKGEELYEDAATKKYRHSKASYFFPSEIDPKAYMLARTSCISWAPQEHFDKFISDMLVLLDHDILIDCNGKSNFFYDETAGFQFIDLDSHTDFKYGLAGKRDSREICAYAGLVPCHYHLKKRAIAGLGRKNLQQLARDNRIIFEKCRAAMLKNEITEGQVIQAVAALQIFGC